MSSAVMVAPKFVCAQLAKPSPCFVAVQTRHQRDGEKPHDHAKQAVGVLGKFIDFAQPPFGVDRAIGQRPIKKSHAGMDAGGKGPQHDNAEHPHGTKRGKPCE